MCSTQSTDVTVSFAGRVAGSQDGNQALTYRYIDVRGRPVVHLCRSTPSTRNRTNPGSYSIAYSWKAAVGSNPRFASTVCVCAPAEYVEYHTRPLGSLKISMSSSCSKSGFL